MKTEVEIRALCLEIASKLGLDGYQVILYADSLFNWVITGEIPARALPVSQ
jgi:hypothetical protein